jgi:hypothetical protein
LTTFLGQDIDIGGLLAQHRQNGLLGGHICFGHQITSTAFFTHPLKLAEQLLQFLSASLSGCPCNRAEALELLTAET